MHLTPIGYDTVLLKPGEALDPSSPNAYLEGVISFLQEHGARRLLYDLGHLPLIDAVYYACLCSLHRACRSAGMEMIGVNIRPTAAFSLARLIDSSPPFDCALDVDSALRSRRIA